MDVKNLQNRYLLECLNGATITPLDLELASLFYEYSKVKGYKIIASYFSPNVQLIKPVLSKLKLAIANKNKYNGGWKLVYFLILWLSVLILTPFPLKNISPFLAESAYNLAVDQLKSAGKQSDAGAVLLARLINRSDCDNQLQFFLTESFNFEKWESFDSDDPLQLSLLKTLNCFLRIASKETTFANFLFLKNFLVRLLQRQEISVVHKRYILKSLGKINLFIANNSIDFKILNGTTKIILNEFDNSNSQIRLTASKQIAKLIPLLDSQSQELIFKFTFDPFVNFDNLQVDNFDVSYNQLHASLMLLGYFFLYNGWSNFTLNLSFALLPKTLFLSHHRLNRTFGLDIRDASCFIAWSLARYSKQCQIPHEIYSCLLLVIITDDEHYIKLASTAALQELVGRSAPVFNVKDNLQNECQIKLIELLDGHLANYELVESILDQLNGWAIEDLINWIWQWGINKEDVNLSHLKLMSNLLLAVSNYFLKLKDVSSIMNILNKCFDLFLENLEINNNNNNNTYLYICIYLFSTIWGNFKELHVDPSKLKAIEIFLNKRLTQFVSDFHMNTIIHYHTATLKRNHHFQFLKIFEMLEANCKGGNIEEIENEMNDWFNAIDNAQIYNFELVKSCIGTLEKGIIPVCASIGYSFKFMQDPTVQQQILRSLSYHSKVKVTTELCRSNSFLIRAIGNYLLKNNDSIYFDYLKIGLTDYTKTEQGDVGSWVRSASINVLSLLLKSKVQIQIPEDLIAQILKLSMEPIITVQMPAVEFICCYGKVELLAFEIDDNLKAESINFNSSVDKSISIAVVDDNSWIENSQIQHFSTMINIYRRNYLRVGNFRDKFWEGFSKSILNVSTFDDLVKSLLSVFAVVYDEEEQNLAGADTIILNFWLDILDVLADNITNSVMVVTGLLKTMLTLLEMNVAAPESIARKIFVRTFNASRGRSGDCTIYAIGIFKYINTAESLDRLIWLSRNHPSARIREEACRAILRCKDV